MADFSSQDLRGSTFSDVDLTGSSFTMVDFSDCDFKAVGFRNVRLRSIDLIDVEITGEITNVTINGVDVAPLIVAELDRRDPERVQMRPDTPEGFREAWTILERRWAETVERARALPPDKLNESVDGEWSFLHTLRHLVYATDSWVGRCVLGDPTPWHPLAWPWDEKADDEAFRRDLAARPTLEEVLVIRAERQATVRHVLDDLTPERLAADTEPVDGPGWPPPQRFPVQECLSIVLNEEWEHRNYAERDLAKL